MDYQCPICAQRLHREVRRYVCPQGHSFDIARQGYVNLLTVQQKHSLDPGDTRQQVLSRRAFLEAGFYAPISDALNRAASGRRRGCAPNGAGHFQGGRPLRRRAIQNLRLALCHGGAYSRAG